MSAGWSLRRRLALALTGAVSILWLAGAATAAFMLQRETDDMFDGALREVAERVLPLAYAELLARETTEAQRVAPVGKKAEYIAYVVRDGAGKVLLHSTDADLSKFPEHPPSGFFSTQNLRGYSVSGVKGTISVTTAENLDHRRSAVRRSIAALIGPLLAVAPAILVAVWVFVTIALKPIERFRAELESRGRGNLAPLSGENLPREVAPVAGAVNALMSRLSDALQAERSFAANSAHELRTPIAAALAQAQRLTAELQDPPRERARAIAAALRRLARLSEKLLQLAKAEGGGLVAPAPKPLAPVLRLVIDDMADHDRDFALDVEGGGPVSDLDPDAFAVLARNLIENAVKHGDPDAAIAIRLAPDRLEVVNHGAVVPPEKLKLLMRPFERGPTRAEGSGLGLAIAASICRGAGLRLELASPAPGEADGFCACVRFPS
ncbi:two-component system OmpR family sensor kinase [Rhodoblastus acidophilus]|nr:ATP-binding protein [Rhodoblastus acidophilus]MCW2273658.1 two-component system OmpR family sensor kinase [Rhodoblastus acidophilus]